MPVFRGTFAGATTTNAGSVGFVPAPSSGLSTRLLYSDSKFKNLIILPQYKPASTIVISNPYIGYGGSATTSLAPSDKFRAFTLMYIPSTGQVNTLIWRTASAPTSSYNVHVGVWRVGDDGLPSTYITGSTSASGTAGSTDIETSITSVELEAGWLFFSLTPDATQAATSITGQNSTTSAFVRRSLSNNMLGLSTGVCFVYTCLTSYNQTSHETFLTSSLSNPMLGFKYA